MFRIILEKEGEWVLIEFYWLLIKYYTLLHLFYLWSAYFNNNNIITSKCFSATERVIMDNKLEKMGKAMTVN
jgi:hypothetical protein